MMKLTFSERCTSHMRCCSSSKLNLPPRPRYRAQRHSDTAAAAASSPHLFMNVIHSYRALAHASAAAAADTGVQKRAAFFDGAMCLRAS